MKLALQHHPDRQGGGEDKTPNTTDTTATFIQIRQAFEVIREGKNGRAEATDESQWSEEDLREFMEEQTTAFLSFKMDHETRKAVIQTVTDLSPGGLDRGGTWEMARMLAQREKGAPFHGSPDAKRVTAVAESSSSSVQRRRRR